MRKGKRLLCILLVFCMALSLLPGAVLAADGAFADVKKTDWFYEEVQYVYSHGLMKGTGTDTFSPDLTTTRGMIVTILWRLEGEPSVKGTQFADVAENAYYAEAILWAAENGIVTGYGSNRFGPDDPITREQLAAILYRYAQYKELDTSASDSLKGFTDASKISTYAKEAMGWACAVGLLQGSHNALDPQGNATRAQVAAILYRFNTTDFEEKKQDSSTGSSGNPVIPNRPTEPEEPVEPEEPEEPEKTFEIAFNGETVKIQEPIVIDGTMYLALEDMLELYGYEFFWMEDYDTVVAIRNGKVLRFRIGSTTVERDGEEPVILPSAPIAKDGVPMIAAGALDELLGCKTESSAEDMTLSINGAVPALIDYYLPDAFCSLGTWKKTGDLLMGRSGVSTPDQANPEGGEPAVLQILIKKAGTYRIWVNAFDHVSMPGSRHFRVTVDGELLDVVFGQHHMATEGGLLYWTDGGELELSEGVHTIELLDTSAFYARCGGIIISQDLDFNPNEDTDVLNSITPYDPLVAMMDPVFPEWAKAAEVSAEKELVLENSSTKIVFSQGRLADRDRDVVQNEIYIKNDGSWLAVKEKTEELGYLMLDATSSEYVTTVDQIASNLQTFNLGGREISMATKNFYQSGNSTWFIPSGMEQVDAHTVKLTFEPNQKADLEVLFSLEDDAQEPTVTVNAKFHQDGSYSFLLYSGDAVAYEDFDRVTAPLLYVKKDLPEGIGSVTAECFMFTPMSTFTYDNDGNKLTSGIVVDPSEITMEDNYSYPDTSKFGFTFQNTDGLYRNQLVAPMFGTEHCRFQAGETYSFSFRLVNRCEDWFDTFQYVTEEMYNLSDVRENYYSSINEAIYNATDLMLNDDYGGWDDNAMSFYNMENQDLVTMANPLEILQRYLLTEDETWLEERVIPTLAYTLSRPSYHCLPTAVSGGGYVPQGGPTDVGSPIAQFGTNVYGGLYEMTQGRVPYLLDYAVNNVNVQPNLSGINSMIAMYKYTGNALYQNKLIELADVYLKNNPIDRMDMAFENNFVYGDYINTTTAFLNAYEVTGLNRYLEAAEQCAELLMTGLWTTGYQSDRLTTDYTISPAATMERLLSCDANNARFWWHGSEVWRLGNVDGEAKKPQDLDLMIKEETVPAWLLAKAGMGTEHTSTPGNGNVITMNNWVGTLQRLASYTGEDYFEMQARNATLGRYSNYAGYYQDRNIVHQMEETYPYTGPDYTSIYWHHIPSFVAMLEDYLINSVWTKSNGNIEFPGINQNGYAYFASSQYGQEAGEFYDQDGMWLWLDRGIVELENVNLDYIAARKDGVLGLAFVNEANETTTTTIRLGDKVPGGSSFTGTAAVYDAAGAKSTVSVTNGSFTLTIRSKEIRSVVLNISGVETPGYVREYTYSNVLGDTYQTFDNARAHVLQMTDENYFAYVYTTLKADAISKLTVEYTYGEVTGTAEDTEYPFEAIIKVTDPNAAFTYKMTVTKLDGSTEVVGEGTLKAQTTGTGVNVPGSTEDVCQPTVDTTEVDAFKMHVAYGGTTGGNVRLATYQVDYPALFQEGNNFRDNALAGMKGYVVFRNTKTGEVTTLEGTVSSNEVREENGNKVAIVVFSATKDVPTSGFDDYRIELALCGANCETDLSTLFDLNQKHPYQLTLESSSGNSFTVEKKDFLNDLTEVELTGMLLHVEAAGADGSERTVQTPVTAAVVGEGTVTLTIADGIIQAEETVTCLALKPVLMPEVQRIGVTNVLRIVTDTTSYALTPDSASLNSFRMYAKFVDKETNDIIYVDQAIIRNEPSAYDANGTVLVTGLPTGLDLSANLTEKYNICIVIAEQDCEADLKAIVDRELLTSVELKLVRQGSNVENGVGMFRFVVSKEGIPEQYATAGGMNGMWLEAEFIPKSGESETLYLKGQINRNGDADGGVNTTVVIPGSESVPAGDYSSHEIKLTLLLAQEKEAFENTNVEAFELNVLRNGSAPGLINLVAEKAAFPQEILNNYETNVLKGMKVYAILTNEATGEMKILDTVVDSSRSSSEADGTESVVVCCTATEAVPAADYTAWTIQAAMCGANCTTDLGQFLTQPSGPREPVTLQCTFQGSSPGNFRLIVLKDGVPEEYSSGNAMVGMWLKVEFTPKSGGETLVLTSQISSVEDRGDRMLLVVPDSAEVPAGDYTQNTDDTKNYTLTLTLYPDGVE